MEVKTIIKQKGFTMEAVAKKMGITRVTLAQNLSRNPTVGTLQKIADVIGCKVGDFFVDDMDIKDDTNTIICPHCGGKIHFDGEPCMPIHKNIRGKEYYQTEKPEH